VPRLLSTNARAAGILIAIAGLAAIAYLTLQPAPGMQELVDELPPLCLVCGALGGVDVILNVLLFMPLGFGLRLSGVSVARTTLVGALLSATIETVQYRFLAGRDASISDFLTNTLGTLLGALLASAAPTLLWPSERDRRRLLAAAAAVWLTLLVLAGVAFKLSLPATAWWGQWQADLAHLWRFPGRVLDITLDGATLPHTRMARSDDARARMLGGETTVEVVAIPAGRTPALAPLASIFDVDSRQVLLLGQLGRELVYAVRTRAHDLKLHPTMIRLDDAFPGTGADTVTVRGRFDRQTLIVESGTGAGRRAFAFTPNLSSGWDLFVPTFYAFGPEAFTFDALWMLLLALPLGFWSWRRERSANAALPVMALTVVGLGLLPALLGYPMLRGGAWAGALGGLALGWAAAGFIRSRVTA
jgi:hypothetical protein